MSSGLDFSGDNLDHEILFEVLQCAINVSQQLGKAASAIFYESLLSAPSLSAEEVLPRFLKVLETGHSSSVTSLHISELGADIAWEKEVADHKNLRKFSVEIFLSLQALSNKATTWGKVLDVMQHYIKFLVPRKIMHQFDSKVGFNIHTSITVQAMSQFAKVMFESALDILLLLHYLVNMSGQVSFCSIRRTHLHMGVVTSLLFFVFCLCNYFNKKCVVNLVKSIVHLLLLLCVCCGGVVCLLIGLWGSSQGIAERKFFLLVVSFPHNTPQ